MQARSSSSRPLPAILADPTQIRQIIMNLVINASDAIGERSGLIRISTGVMRVDQPVPARNVSFPGLEPGDYVYLEINDDGCGMPPEVKARIFEPFYTTKFAGHGLGLAAVLGIVRSHHGTIKVYSEPGRGTTFKLLFPAIERRPPEPAAADPVSAWRGSGLALVVDDEEAVRSVAARTLESLGFTPLTATDGPRAADFSRTCSRPARRAPGSHHAAHERGGDVPRVVPDRSRRARGPHERIHRERHRRPLRRQGLAGFIQKPFDRKRLQAKVRSVLPRCNDGSTVKFQQSSASEFQTQIHRRLPALRRIPNI